MQSKPKGVIKRKPKIYFSKDMEDISDDELKTFFERYWNAAQIVELMGYNVGKDKASSIDDGQQDLFKH